MPERPLPPYDAVAEARRLLAEGRAFGAHEVFEASWKAAGSDERALWQGLAQLCVGLTHVQRGNRVGAARLLRRGAGRLTGRRPAYGVDVPRLVSDALRLADQVETGDDLGRLEI
ncbi:MAG: uncharacterized protein QOJ79_2033 [Actinomycetota bacterium]|nr:uncharacterized protein [Actinomycetota bacterium]